jgi:hypothetical protein
VDDTAPAPPPELAALFDELKRATTPLDRQRAWDAIVAYQRRAEVRAQPRGAEDPSSSV